MKIKKGNSSRILAMVVIAITLVLLGAGLKMGYFYLNNYFYGSYRLSAREKSIILVTCIIFPNLLIWALSKRGRDTIVQIIAATKLKLSSIIIIATIVIIMTIAIKIISTEYMGIIFLALGFLLMMGPTFIQEHKYKVLMSHLKQHHFHLYEQLKADPPKRKGETDQRYHKMNYFARNHQIMNDPVAKELLSDWDEFNTLGQSMGYSILLLGVLLGFLGMFMSSPKESTLPKGCISFGRGQIQCGYK